MGALTRVTEQILSVFSFNWTGMRSGFSFKSGSIHASNPAYENTTVSYTEARSLYLNNQGNFNLGGFFAAPIIDLTVDFVGHPIVTTDREEVDDFLNKAIQCYWVDEICQMLRNTLRDTKTVVRLQQDGFSESPLITMDESAYCRLEIIDPERVEIFRNPNNAQIIDKAIIRHNVPFMEDEGDLANNVMPRVKEHEIFEEITPEQFKYFDHTDQIELTDWNMPNIWGFVPLVEVFNEYDSTLKGGYSELEQVYPLIHAFHDCLTIGLQAHKYHSIPKVKMKLNDVTPFLKNNFPDAFDSDGKFISGTTISWQGKEILFLQSEEDADFLEAQSVLGDTKVLADFLVDCICIASQTPRWAFMDVEAGSANQANNAQTLPWAKKIMRKRKNFTKPMQELLKMLMVANGIQVVRPEMHWEIIRVEDQVTYAQAIQQLVMALEVAAQRQIISDTTYREILRAFLPNMKPPSIEKREAEDNFVAEVNPNGTANVPVDAGQQGQNE